MKLIIMGQPVSKKNKMQLVRVRGRLIPIPSVSYKAWLKGAKQQIKGQMDGVAWVPFTTHIHLQVMIYRWSWRKIDLSNIIEAVQDMLQECRIIEDDSLVRSLDGSRMEWGVPKDEARVEITIEEILPW